MKPYGYLTRAPYSSITHASATCSQPNARNIQVSASWIGFYGISGSVFYEYDKVTIKTDENGNRYIVTTKATGSDTFVLSPRVTYISDKEANE